MELTELIEVEVLDKRFNAVGRGIGFTTGVMYSYSFNYFLTMFRTGRGVLSRD